jgi:hypothetical protein
MSHNNFLAIRATLIEPIIRQYLPSASDGTLKATVCGIHAYLYVWIHESFDYSQDFIILFQRLYGSIFTDFNLRFHPLTVFRHDLRWTWLTTQSYLEASHVFRVHWEANGHTTALRSTDGSVQAFGVNQRQPLENLDAIFIETLDSFASLSRANMYLPVGYTQFPKVEIASLNVTQFTSILREVRAGIITAEDAPNANPST